MLVAEEKYSNDYWVNPCGFYHFLGNFVFDFDALVRRIMVENCLG